MTTAARARQVWTIAKFQLGRVFFSRRSLWVYLLALFPTAIFFIHGLEMKWTQSRLEGRAVSASVLESVQQGETLEAVKTRAGKPVNESNWTSRRDEQEVELAHLGYYDGHRRWAFHFSEGVLQRINTERITDFGRDRTVFAAVFHHFYLRLAIFFGCLGVFMNLFRGEMLDKTLHYWFLVPARREVLLLGKYLAGLIAAIVVFTGGAVLCYAVVLWPQDAAELEAFWRDHGLSHAFWYAGAAALACIGYGSVFLAAGLLLRNPILPAIVILLWEGVNPILPAALQKLSVLHYVQSLAPVPLPIETDAPMLIQLLMAPAEPPSVTVAVLGLLALTAAVLWVASRSVRRLEIDYGTD